MKRIFILAVSLILLISLVGTMIFGGVYFAKKINDLENLTKEAERLALLSNNKDNESDVDMVSEVCELSIGDPLMPWLVERIGCELPTKTAKIDIEIKNEWKYSYFIAGYKDPAYLNRFPGIFFINQAKCGAPL